jgi:hypothetical protein
MVFYRALRELQVESQRLLYVTAGLRFVKRDFYFEHWLALEITSPLCSLSQDWP